MAGTAAQGSGAVGGEHGEEVDYDGRFFGNDKTRKVAQATFSPVANSKPIAIWPARPAPDPPQGHSKGTPLPSIETESLPVDASPDGAVSAVSTFSNVPLLSNPPYKPTGRRLEPHLRYGAQVARAEGPVGPPAERSTTSRPSTAAATVAAAARARETQEEEAQGQQRELTLRDDQDPDRVCAAAQRVNRRLCSFLSEFELVNFMGGIRSCI